MQGKEDASVFIAANQDTLRGTVGEGLWSCLKQVDPMGDDAAYFVDDTVDNTYIEVIELFTRGIGATKPQRKKGFQGKWKVHRHASKSRHLFR